MKKEIKRLYGMKSSRLFFLCMDIFRLFIACLLFSFFHLNCATSSPDGQETDTTVTVSTSQTESLEPYMKMAIKKYKSDIDYRFNSVKTHVLCVKIFKPTKENPYPPLAFFLYDLKGDTRLFEDSSARGHVKWLNDHQIQISLIPGIVTGDEENNKRLTGYIYDLKLKRKIYANDKALKDQK